MLEITGSARVAVLDHSCYVEGILNLMYGLYSDFSWKRSSFKHWVAEVTLWMFVYYSCFNQLGQYFLSHSWLVMFLFKCSFASHCSSLRTSNDSDINAFEFRGMTPLVHCFQGAAIQTVQRRRLCLVLWSSKQFFISFQLLVDASVGSLQELFFVDACCRVPIFVAFQAPSLYTIFSSILSITSSLGGFGSCNVGTWHGSVARWQRDYKRSSKMAIELVHLWSCFLCGHNRDMNVLNNTYLCQNCGLWIQNESTQAGVCKVIISKGEMPYITTSGAAQVSILLLRNASSKCTNCNSQLKTGFYGRVLVHHMCWC